MSSYSDFVVDLNNKNSSWTIVYGLIDKGSKVLDIGCSSGYFDDILIKDKKCIVDGIEIDREDADRASKICRSVVVGNVEDEQFPIDSLDGNYDCILFIDVLEHLLDPAATLRKVSKLLSKDGKIIFSIPNMANSSVRLQLLQGNFDYESEGLLDETHLHYYTAHTIDSMVERSKLYYDSIQFTTFDIPKAMIKDVLNGVGLESTKKFEEFLTSKDASVYQYIAALSRKKSKSNASIFSSRSSIHSIKPRSDYEVQITDLQKIAIENRDNFEKSQHTISKLEVENERLRNDIKNNKLPVILRKVYSKTINRKK